jgi:urease subunit beta
MGIAFGSDDGDAVIPGEIFTTDEPIVLFDGQSLRTVEVRNTGDRPIQVGSHYHFAEANPALVFDRAVAHGCRLAIPAGTSVRFEPGIERNVDLVPLGGLRIVSGLRGAVAGPLDDGSADEGGIS